MHPLCTPQAAGEGSIPSVPISDRQQARRSADQDETIYSWSPSGPAHRNSYHNCAANEYGSNVLAAQVQCAAPCIIRLKCGWGILIKGRTYG